MSFERTIRAGTDFAVLAFGSIVAYTVLTGVALTNVVSRPVCRVSRGVETFSVSLRDCLPPVVGTVSKAYSDRWVAGALATMPFNGSPLRIVGIASLLFVPARSVDPRACRGDNRWP